MVSYLPIYSVMLGSKAGKLGQMVQRNHILQNGSRLFSVASSQQAKDTIGFVGLGNMGAYMAKNLLKNDYPVIAFDVSADAVRSVTDAGATGVGSPAEVAGMTTKLVTMLPSSPHVREVYTGAQGIFSTIQEGSLLIDSSTIDPFVSKEMDVVAKDKGVTFMDAPVSGGVLGARDALLTFMVGGPERHFDAAKAILSSMGKNIVHCGPVGTGQAAKICNNMLLAISMVGTSEAMNLGIKLGLDPNLLANILNTSSGRCWSSELYNPCPGVKEGVPAGNDYDGGFATVLMTKDLGLAQDAATTTQTPTPMGSLAHQLYRIMSKTDMKSKDFSVVFKFLQEQQ